MSEVTTKEPTLQVSSTALLKKELFAGSDGANIAVADEKSIDSKADEFVQKLLEFNPEDVEAKRARTESVEQMGAEVQKRAAKQSELLRQPVRKMSERGEEKGGVANALIDLKVQVEDLDPGKFDFEPGWFTRTLGQIPGVGTPIKRYFSKFESSQTIIGTIIRSLENGRDQLQRDNITLTEDQKQMRDATKKLEHAVKLGQLMDQKIQYRLERDIQPTDPKHKFVAEELLFPLRQRIIDLQQQLAVAQQGVLATEIIIRNNKELVRGVERALNVTVSALETAASVAMALANQKIVLDKINSVSKTTSDLIAGTAARLKTQGTEIHKQASSATLDLESLKSAFADIKIAMDDVSNFRVNALPQMANTILELDKVSADAEMQIKKMEKGNQAKPEIRLEVE